MRSWMIGMVLGIVSVGYWPVLPPWQAVILFVGAALVIVFRQSPLTALVAGIGLGCVAGFLHGTSLLHSRITPDCVGLPLTVSGTVSSLPRESLLRGGVPRQRFGFNVADLKPTHCAGPVNLQLSYYGEHRILPGDIWQFEVRLKRPWGLANPGLYNMQEWFARNSIDAVGSVRDSGRVPRLIQHAEGVDALPDRLRQRISAQIDQLGLAPDVTAVLQAVSVADGSGIASSLWFLFQQFGINHLLVISGLHVGMVAAVGYFLGGVCLRLLPPGALRGSWLPSVVALCLACLYGALAGLSLPVQRALCMLACFVCASLAGRKSVAASSLLLAAVCVLLINPLAAVGSGFWLSFGAVAALLWFAQWQRGLGSFWRVLRAQGAMSLIMLPLGALFFGGGSLVSVLANLLMIPLVGWLVVPLTLLAAVCYLCGWEIAATLWRLAAWPLDFLLPLARELGEDRGAWLYMSLSADPALAILGVLSVLLCVLPGRSPLKVLALVMALPVLLPVQLPSGAPSLSTRVTVLDVGQGTAVVVRSGRYALLYDTGGGDPDGVNMGTLAVLPFLQRQGITALDTLVISHPDLDHSAGTAAVRNSLPVSRFRYGGIRADNGEEMPAGRPCVAGEAWRWPGGQTFQFLSPAQELPPRSNDSSCVLQVQVGKYRILLPGDIEAGREKMLARYWGSQLASDWLAAAHHGSKTSSSTPFLKRVQPQVVVISSGYANRFGHPHPDVIERYLNRDTVILSTASSGALDFTIEPGKEIQITAHRQALRRYWM
ncbi:MAG: DNA internalization-related competence protein ComEC/Rec2 [Halioglobus sp.]|nr:DNA internalization-related competence protein ComEC/Rec2 [Halioglobus sp.]